MVDNETPVTSSLLMDRSEPLGNSPDDAVPSRRRLHVKVANTPGESIPFGAAGFSVLSPGFPKQVEVDPSGTIVLPANSARTYAHFFNNSASVIYLQFGSVAIVGQGLKLYPGAFFQMSGWELWMGDVYAITPSLTVNLDCMEAI